jgi:hypothetical protein
MLDRQTLRSLGYAHRFYSPLETLSNWNFLGVTGRASIKRLCTESARVSVTQSVSGCGLLFASVRLHAKVSLANRATQYRTSASILAKPKNSTASNERPTHPKRALTLGTEYRSAFRTMPGFQSSPRAPLRPRKCRHYHNGGSQDCCYNLHPKRHARIMVDVSPCKISC